jgi:hypothetical protein
LLSHVGPGASSAQPIVVFAEEFASPESVTPWIYRSDPETLVGGGIQWSSTEGQPAGSLELVMPGGTGNTGRAFSICLPFGGDEPWTTSVDVMPVGAAVCGIDFVDHDAPDCSDDRIGAGQGAGAGFPNQWITLERERPLFPPPEHTRAIRLELHGSTTGAPGGGSCHFDNIVVTGTTAPPSVPAQRPALLVVTATSMALFAAWMLRVR